MTRRICSRILTAIATPLIGVALSLLALADRCEIDCDEPREL